MKKWFLLILWFVSFIGVSVVIGTAAHHMYFHHDKESAIGMLVGFVVMCICDTISFFYHRQKDKKEKR